MRLEKKKKTLNETQRENEDESREGKEKAGSVKLVKSPEVKRGRKAIERYLDLCSLMFLFHVYFQSKSLKTILTSLSATCQCGDHGRVMNDSLCFHTML